MHYGHTQCVQPDKTQDSPVEALRLDHASDEEADPFLFPVEVRGVIVLAALHAGPGERRSLGCSGDKRTHTHTLG